MRLRRSVPFAIVLAAVPAITACRPAAPAVEATSASTASLVADIDTLTNSAFGGREAGTAGADSSVDFLVRRYRRLGLRPLFRSACDETRRCEPSYADNFPLGTGLGHNVGAIVQGTDFARSLEHVVIGAHFDGLGHSPTWALDRDAGFVLRSGADDNASGTAVVLELARRFRECGTKRSIMLLDFDAEEEGRVGSRAVMAKLPGKAVFMINLDMVGRLNRDRLFVEGRPADPGIRAIFDDAAATTGLRLQFIPRDGLSDDASFVEAGIAAAYLSTGRHDDYHTARDVAGRLNIDGLRRVVDFTELVARGIADR